MADLLDHLDDYPETMDVVVAGGPVTRIAVCRDTLLGSEAPRPAARRQQRVQRTKTRHTVQSTHQHGARRSGNHGGWSTWSGLDTVGLGHGEARQDSSNTQGQTAYVWPCVLFQVACVRPGGTASGSCASSLASQARSSCTVHGSRSGLGTCCSAGYQLSCFMRAFSQHKMHRGASCGAFAGDFGRCRTIPPDALRLTASRPR
jgi:hypothetical protein